jgi:hypothetical protein
MSCVSQSLDRIPQPFPGGYCTQLCVDKSDCGAGAVCSPNFAVITMGTCFQACEAQNDCRDGYICRTLTESALGLKDKMATSNLARVCALPATDGQDAGM